MCLDSPWRDEGGGRLTESIPSNSWEPIPKKEAKSRVDDFSERKKQRDVWQGRMIRHHFIMFLLPELLLDLTRLEVGTSGINQALGCNKC